MRKIHWGGCWCQENCIHLNLSKITVSYACFVGNVLQRGSDTRQRHWLRHCATSRKVAGSTPPDEVFEIFHWLNPSGRTLELGVDSTSGRNKYQRASLGVKAAGAQGWHLTTLWISWEPHIPGVFGAYLDLHRDSFAFTSEVPGFSLYATFISPVQRTMTSSLINLKMLNFYIFFYYVTSGCKETATTGRLFLVKVLVSSQSSNKHSDNDCFLIL